MLPAAKLAAAVLLLVACHPTGAAEPAQLLVTCYPKSEPYYQELLPDILNYLKELDTKVKEGGDELIILYSGAAPELTGHNWQHAALLQTQESWDMWMRDYTTPIPDRQAIFKYRPNYLSRATARYVQGQLNAFLNRIGVTLTNKSPLVVDGGNIVDNGYDKAILTERVLMENPGETRAQIKDGLARALDRDILLIPDAGDTTGHSDGMVSFLDEYTLLVGDYGYPEDKTLAQIISRAFPGVQVVMLPSFEVGPNVPKWNNFDSAVGAYSNALVTYRAVYFPQFDDPLDQSNLQLVKSLTTKTVVPVNTAKLSKMGGSVRCMTWQIDGDNPIATRLFELTSPSTRSFSDGYETLLELLGLQD